MTDILHICSTKVTPTLEREKSCMNDSCAPVFSEGSWCTILSFLCWWLIVKIILLQIKQPCDGTKSYHNCPLPTNNSHIIMSTKIALCTNINYI